METFQACAFKSFCRILLGLESPPQAPTLGRRELGSIAHEALNRFFRSDQKQPLKQIIREAQHRILQGLDYGFDEEQQLFNLENSLRMLIEAEQSRWLPILGATPLRFEFQFGSKTEPIWIEGQDRKEPFQGRIDRIDELDQGLLVIDYKLSYGEIGKKQIEEIRLGQLPQLPIYMKAVSQILGKQVIGGQIEQVKKVNRSGFFNKTQISEKATSLLAEEKNQLLDSETFTALMDQAISAIFDGCQKLRQGLIEINPTDPSKTCNLNSCDYFDICRYAL